MCLFMIALNASGFMVYERYTVLNISSVELALIRLPTGKDVARTSRSFSLHQDCPGEMFLVSR